MAKMQADAAAAEGVAAAATSTEVLLALRDKAEARVPGCNQAWLLTQLWMLSERCDVLEAALAGMPEEEET